MSHTRSLIMPPRSVSRVDQWALINQQKTLELRKSVEYEHFLADQKRRKLKQQLDAQVNQKQMRQRTLRQNDHKLAIESFQKVNVIEQVEKQRKMQSKMRRKQMQQINRHLFSNVIDSNVKDQNSNMRTGYNMEIGYQAQLQRRQKFQNEKRNMTDELDRQIKEKQRIKNEYKELETRQDRNDLSYQYKISDHRRKEREHHYNQNQKAQKYYQHLLEKKNQKDRQFDYKQIDLIAKQKLEEQTNKANIKDMEVKNKNQKMKQILDQQVIIHQQKKREEERINPQELSYGLMGKMVNNRYNNFYHPSSKQKYSQDLQRQIQERQMKKQTQKYMSEEEYKINLNQLNRAVDGTFADKTYIDRSIHALSEPHSVNVTLFDAKVQRPDALSIKPKLQELIQRKHKRSTLLDHNNSF